MPSEKRFLVDVGMQELPFPIRAASRAEPEGQRTIANISIDARIMHQFEAGWIDRFIQILHAHRDRIGTSTLSANIMDYLHELQARSVKIDFDYPYFIEKLTPVAKEKCLVRYRCTYSAKVASVEERARVHFAVQVPAITTYPVATEETPGGLFGQLSIVAIETACRDELYPEDLVDIVDKRALVPVYSFLTPEDQAFVIEKVHSERKSSVVMMDEVKSDLARNPNVEWYSVSCSNYGMLHSYSTVIRTEKSMWVPFSSYEQSEI